MHAATNVTDPPRTPEERAHLTFWSLGAGADGAGQERDIELELSSSDGPAPHHPVPVAERIRKLPEALLLTAGYYGGRIPVLRELLKPRD